MKRIAGASDAAVTIAMAAMTCILTILLTTSYRVAFAADTMAWPASLGAPQSRRADVRVLSNPGFVVGYDSRRGRAAWVAYRVTPVADYSDMPRPDFQPDPRLHVADPNAVFQGSRYDRGHLAPNYAMAQLYGAAAQRASFYYSNIAPQTPRLNQLVWQRLEEIEIDDLAPRLDTLWVLVGPMYPSPEAALPSAYFRIWLDRAPDGRWRALALRVPQQVRGDERLDRFLMSVDAVERATGLDFFAGLPPAAEKAVETMPADANAWGFDAVACMPARYGERWQGRGGIVLRYDRCG